MCPVAKLRWADNGTVLADMKNDIFTLIFTTMQACGIDLKGGASDIQHNMLHFMTRNM